MPPLKLKADVITVSHDGPAHNYTRGVKGERRILTGPGEYEIGGVFVTGVATEDPKGRKANGLNTIYVFDFDGLAVAHLGRLAHVPSQAEIEALGAVHIALVPIGGGGALAPSQAAEVISLIEPSVVVPMYYKTPALELKLGTLARFLSEMGLKEVQPQPALKVTRSDLSEDTQVIVLEPAA